MPVSLWQLLERQKNKKLHAWVIKIIHFTFSFFSRIPGYRVGCYYCLFQQEKLLPQTATMDSEHNSSEYVVCFLGGSEKGLELYPFFGLWGHQEGKCWQAGGELLPPTSENVFHLLYIDLNFIPSHDQFVLACFNWQLLERFYITYCDIKTLSWFILYCFLKNILSGLNWTSTVKG